MTFRISHQACRRLLPRLPRNLVMFDGHCLMCQARVQYVLQRNFSFFHYRSVLYEDKALAARRLEQHALHFASFDSSEGREMIQRCYLQRQRGPAAGEKKKQRGTGTSPPNGSSAAALPDDLVVMLIEKVPSRQHFFLRQMSAVSAGEKRDDRLWARQGRSPTHALSQQDHLVISVNFEAVCRIGMHMDRAVWRLVFRCLYYFTPRRLGAWWFKRSVTQRRHRLWGTSEEDGVEVLSRIEGMKERRWRWRNATR